jgi:hypothetical protein
LGYGQIHTFFHAGGITSASIRSSDSASTEARRAAEVET